MTNVRNRVLTYKTEWTVERFPLVHLQGLGIRSQFIGLTLISLFVHSSYRAHMFIKRPRFFLCFTYTTLSILTKLIPLKRGKKDESLVFQVLTTRGSVQPQGKKNHIFNYHCTKCLTKITRHCARHHKRSHTTTSR
jgi:hypothetical protein